MALRGRCSLTFLKRTFVSGVPIVSTAIARSANRTFRYNQLKKLHFISPSFPPGLCTISILHDTSQSRGLGCKIPCLTFSFLSIPLEHSNVTTTQSLETAGSMTVSTLCMVSSNSAQLHQESDTWSRLHTSLRHSRYSLFRFCVLGSVRIGFESAMKS